MSKHEELIIKKVLDNLYHIEYDYPIDLIRLWIQFHRVLDRLIENPDYDIELYFAKPIQVMIQKESGLNYEYQHCYELLKHIQSYTDEIKILENELESLEKTYKEEINDLLMENKNLLKENKDLLDEIDDLKHNR